MTEQNKSRPTASIDQTIARILAADEAAQQKTPTRFVADEQFRTGPSDGTGSNNDTGGRSVLDGTARVLADDEGHTEHDGDQFELFERRRLRRVEGLSTELQDVTEVENRQLRLERVVLAGLYRGGSAEEAEHSLRELAALAKTAGSTVLDGFLQ